jgi:radical SAM superfamily enzyme YgiQ (UPF0313 family)
VDDNLIGIHKGHLDRAKDLFKAMIQANLGKYWIAQVSINVADDEELLRLAAKAGCIGVLMGFESATEEGLEEIDKKFNIPRGRDLKASVRRIQRYGIGVAGSFIIGLDADQKGIGRQIAAVAKHYGLDLLNLAFLTPLPGTGLWQKMEAEGRITANNFPEDWKYYTFTFPVAKYLQLSWADLIREMDSCSRDFYSYPHILHRLWASLWRTRRPFPMLVSTFSCKNNLRINRKVYRGLGLEM